MKDIWDNIKWSNSHVTGAPEEEERENGMKKYFKRKWIRIYQN